MSEPTAFNGTNPNTHSYWNQAIESKWMDVALITSFLTLSVIAIAASAGMFNSIGTTHAAYLSYGMYAGAGLCLIAEIVKVAVKCSKMTRNEGQYLMNTQKNSVKFDANKNIGEQITRIEFSRTGNGCTPPTRDCAITFVNGETISGQIDCVEAYALIHNLGSKKCFHQASLENATLNDYVGFEPENWAGCSEKMWGPDKMTPHAIVERLLKNKPTITAG